METAQHTPGKIVQIAMAQSEEACIGELFLDEHGTVWTWEHKHEDYVEQVEPHGLYKDQDIVRGTRTYFRRLSPVSLNSDWMEIHKSPFSDQRARGQACSNPATSRTT